MCVWLIDQTYNPPLDERNAWKIFIKTPEGLRFPHWSLDGTYKPGAESAEGGKWLKAINVQARAIRGEKYVTGFHVFPNRESAHLWCKRENAVVVPVLVRNIRLHGLHAEENKHKDVPTISVWIADELLILV
jgi:hypothetical protein